MTNAQTDSQVLDLECDLFCNYLIGRRADDDYVSEKYRLAHSLQEDLQEEMASPFDRLLVRLIRSSSFSLRFVDSYSSVFCQTSIVRKKMILVLAILESSSAAIPNFEFPDQESKTRFVLRAMWTLTGSVFIFVVSSLILTPIQILFRYFPGMKGSR